MIRQMLVSVARKRSTITLRHFATGTTTAQKRALNKLQIDAHPDPVTPPPATPPPVSEGGDSSGLVLPALGAITVIAGVAYYFDVFGINKEFETTPATIKEETKEIKEDPVYEVKKEGIEDDTKDTEEVSSATTVEAEVAITSGNRVVSIDIPKVAQREIPPVRVIEHPETGNRVHMDVVTVKSEKFPTAMDATKELLKTEENDTALQEAHKALLANQDMTLFRDLDQLSSSELKIRVVQLATSMKDQTKWEAVRLQEHLSQKEKAVAAQYMESMQKQRMELEDLLAKKLRDQQDAMERQANSILQQKDANIQALVKEATDSLQAQYQAAFETVEERVKTEFDANNKKAYLEKLDEQKAKFINDIREKVAKIEQLSEKLQQLESALSVSRSFEKGSLQAHQMSAAALALAEKLETSKAGQEELDALSAAAEKESIIALALKTIPESIKFGIPTISELQTKFEKVQKKSRQAALVPEGRVGLEGQLLGILFSTLKYAPSPDDAAPEENKDDAEYVLARARRHVQLGELEQAVEQLNKLKGQPAFTIQDWKKSALDRIATDKALHVIKMECAVMNKSMSSAGVSS